MTPKLFHPPHLYFDDVIYFLTARTYGGREIFDTPEKKNILLKSIAQNFNFSQYKIFAWVILDNHYHLLFKTFSGRALSAIANKIHGQSSLFLNKIDNQVGRKVFQNYFDRCVRDEKEFWLYFNYIHHNPVKHNYCSKQDEVIDYSFCSYRQWVTKKGQDWVDSAFYNYPIFDFTLE